MNRLYLFLLLFFASTSAFGLRYYPQSVSLPTGSTTTYCIGTQNVTYSATVTMCGTTSGGSNTLDINWYFNDPTGTTAIYTTTYTPTSTSSFVVTLPASVLTFATAGTFTGTSGLRVVVSTTASAGGSGCSTSASSAGTTINVNSPAISGTLAACAGNTCTLTATPTGGTWSATGSATVSATGVVGGATAGTATISYNSGACIVTSIFTVTPGPTISGPSAACSSGSATLTGTPSGGTWASGSPSVAGITASGGVVTPGIAGTSLISYTVSGCTSTMVFTVSALPAPIAGPGIVCIGNSISLTDATASGTWATSANATIVSTTGVLTGTSAGTTTVSYVVPGCPLASTIVTVSPAMPAITGNTGAICPTTTLTLANASAGGTWSAITTTVATVNPTTGVVRGMSGGNSVISYISSPGCYAATTVTVSPGPTAITGPTAVCLGSTITLGNTVSGGTWSSLSSGIASVTPTTGYVSGVSSGATMISYTASGCTATLIVSINTNPLPISPTGLPGVCDGANLVMSDVSPSGFWSVSGAASIGAISGILTGVGSGAANVTYTLPTGCIATRLVTVYPNPAVPGPTNGVCLGNAVSMSSSLGGGTWASSNTGVINIGSGTGMAIGMSVGTAVITYTLNTGCFSTLAMSVGATPSAIAGPASVCSLDTITMYDAVPGGVWSVSGTSYIDPVTGLLTGGIAGIATVTYTTPGCGPVTRTVTVNALPAPITGATSVCASTVISLSSTTTGGTWSSSDTTLATVNSTGQVTGLGMGVVTITYKLPGAGGCRVTQTVTVNPQAPIAGDDTVCAGSVTYLTNIVGGGTWTSSNPAIGTIHTTSGAFMGLATGISYVIYSLPTGCTVSALIAVLPQQPSITGASEICSGTATTLANAYPGGRWHSNNMYVAAVDSVTGAMTAGFPDTVTVTYRSAHGCISSTILTVDPLPTPVIVYNPAPPPPSTLSVANYYTAYQWYLGSTVVPGATNAAYALPTTAAIYSVTVTDTNGCMAGATWKGNVLVNTTPAITAVMYPNPVGNELHILCPVKLHAIISGIDGKVLVDDRDAHVMNISKLPAGVYMVTGYDSEGNKLLNERLLKE